MRGPRGAEMAVLWRGRNHVIEGLVERFVGMNYSCFSENIEGRIIEEIIVIHESHKAGFRINDVHYSFISRNPSPRKSS
jgi:hypothetical protein